MSDETSPAVLLIDTVYADGVYPVEFKGLGADCLEKPVRFVVGRSAPLFYKQFIWNGISVSLYFLNDHRLAENGPSMSARAKWGFGLFFALALSALSVSPGHAQVSQGYDDLNRDCMQATKSADFAQGEKICSAGLRAAEKFGPNDDRIANSLTNLAGLYFTHAKYAEAMPLLQRAQGILERTVGPDHPRVAANLSFMGLVYDKQGKPAAAEPLLLRAVAIDEKNLEPNHPDFAKRLNNLGWIYFRMGLDAKAEPLLKRAFAIRERVLGPEHPEVGTSLHNLGLLYSRQGKYADAELMLQKSIGLREKALGPNNPALAGSLTSLAEVYRASGKLSEAERLARQAIDSAEKQPSPNPQSLATYINNLAGIYVSQGKYAEAVKLHERALTLREKALGKDHPEVATDRTNLARAKMLQGKELSTDQAEQIASIDSFLQGISTVADGRCQSLRQLAEKYAAEGNVAEAETTRGTIGNVCECMPTQAGALRSTLNSKELETRISEADFVKRFKPQIIDKCAAEQVRFMFANDCGDRSATPNGDNVKYCKCLSRQLSMLADSEIADIGIAAADYIPRAAEAKKSGAAPPEQPFWIKRFFAIDAECKAE